MESNWEENDPSSPSFHPQLFPFTYCTMNRIPSGLTRKFVSVFKAGTLESWGSSEETSQQTIWAWVRHSSSRLSRKVLSRTVSRLSPATSPLLFQSLLYQTDFVSDDGLSIPSLAETVRTVIKRIETLSGVTINRCWFYYNFSNAFWRDWKFLHEFSRIESTRETLYSFKETVSAESNLWFHFYSVSLRYFTHDTIDDIVETTSLSVKYVLIRWLSHPGKRKK